MNIANSETLSQAKPLETLIQELPFELREEVRDFVEFILAKRQRPVDHTLRQDCAGDLRESAESTLGAVLGSEFFGMWRERADLPSSPELARQLRTRAWEHSV
jgi:hypothetical protein